MDEFFTKKTCDRCGGSLKDGRTMSMFNEDCICMKCKQKELHRTDYLKALDADRREIAKGNFNYHGIGW